MVGVLGIIAILTIKKALTGDGSISLVCKSANETVVLKFDPTSDKAISAKKLNGADYYIEGMDERISKIGVLKYIEEFSRDFENKQGGACFQK